MHLTQKKIKKTIAVVGTRKITSYGIEVTKQITDSLVQTGCVIASSLVIGVDSVAHQTTLENSGKTIAVLGCGVDCCIPITNQRLYDAILRGNGVIISEYPLSSLPTKAHFLQETGLLQVCHLVLW